MTRKVMERKASDNQYLHKDFHGALSNGIEYLHKNFGEEAVREYLSKFTKTFYAPLIEDLKRRGMVALKEHFERIYEIEGGKVEISFNEDELIIKVQECPAITHLHKKNMPVARMFYETSKTVNEMLCDGTCFSAELKDYNEDNGSCIQRFYRRG